MLCLYIFHRITYLLLFIDYSKQYTKNATLSLFLSLFFKTVFLSISFSHFGNAVSTACLGRAPSGRLGRQIRFGFQLQKCQHSRKNGLRFPAWHFCPAGGAGLGDTRGQGSFLDIAKNDNPLAKNDGLEEQANQDLESNQLN